MYAKYIHIYILSVLSISLYFCPPYTVILVIYQYILKNVQSVYSDYNRCLSYLGMFLCLGIR